MKKYTLKNSVLDQTNSDKIADINIFHHLQMQLLLEKASSQSMKLSQLCLLSELQVSFEGGSY